jgi:heme exporter protein CcmD
MMNWAEFFSMGGRGFYVWASFGAFLLLLVIEIVLVRLRIYRAQDAVRDDLLVAAVSSNDAAEVVGGGSRV